MKLLDHYDGGELPFEGDLTLTLRSLPQDARINSARISLTPVDASGGVDPFTETIAFTGNSGDWNATKIANTDWVEVDFHDRRTLAAVQGNNLTGATLQIDLGGAYVEINDKGAIKTPTDDDFVVAANGLLPGLTVNKFKLTAAGSPNIHTVMVRSAPANVHVRLADLPPIWSHVGDMTTAQTSSDFTDVLQALLTELDTDNGYYVLPITLHSDTISRFKVAVEIDYVRETALLPSDLSEVTLPFAYNTVANSEEGLLQVALPPNAEVLPQDTTAKLIGAFEESRIVYGPLGMINAQGEALISPSLTQAQPLALDDAVAATAVDLLLAAVTRTVRLQMDIREDLDGKPAAASLLNDTVEFSLDRETAGQATWISVALPREFQFKGQQEMRYWLIIQSLEGESVWSVDPAPENTLGMQRTDNGGLSWRQSTAEDISGALTGWLRLRHQPERYQVPLELSIGDGDQAQRVKLDRFQPLGRVDFELNIPEVADAFNEYLRQTSPASCFEAEYIADGEFNQWLRTSDELAEPTSIDLAFEPAFVAVTPDGLAAYVATFDSSGWSTNLEKAVTASEPAQMLDLETSGRAIAMTISASGDRLYLLVESEGNELHEIDTSNDQPLSTTSTSIFGASYMAVSPNGSRLYIAHYEYIGAEYGGNVRVYDTDNLESPPQEISIGAGKEPMAIAASAAGTKKTYLYVLVSEVVPTGETYGQNQLYRYDTMHHTLSGTPLNLGLGGGDLAIAACGQLAVVSNTVDKTLNVIDLKQWKVVGEAIDVGAEPNGIVLSPDGERVYGFTESETTSFIGTGDTLRRKIIDTIEVDGRARDIAIAPNGIRLFVPLAGETNTLAIIATAATAPLEWTVMAGRVTRLCYPSPFGNVAVLGISELGTDPVATTLAQVIPITSGCRQSYRFGFWGAATDLEAVAEIEWIDQQCGRLRTDTLPIQRPASREDEDNVIIEPYPIPAAAELILHSMDLTPPEGATQAEVRFRAPFGIAVIDAVSMKVTAAATLNNNLRLDAQGQPFHWSPSPQADADEASPLLITVVDSGIRLRNVSAEAVSLIQTVPVTAEQTYQFELHGRINEVFTEESLPQTGVLWQNSEGATIEPDIGLDVSPNHFVRYAATGTIPAQAVQAEVFVSLPPETSLDVQTISLQQTTLTDAPVAFLAHAPGELTLSQAQVVYDIAESAATEIPASGLCQPIVEAPPADTRAEACGYCGSCQSITGVCEIESAITQAGRPASVGTCRRCGSFSVILGGRLLPGAPTVTRLANATPSPLPRSIGRPPPITRRPTPPPGATTPLAQPTEATLSDLTLVKGIGEARARLLAAADITSIEKLASLAPEEVERIVPGISLAQATKIAEAAQRIALKE